MPRVIDAVPFFNERDIWHLRYETLRNVVDGFVVVEAFQTHSGEPKGCTFRKPPGDEDVRYWQTDLPDRDCSGIPATRRREMYQRNAILDALTVPPFYVVGTSWLDADDIILISDCDEIPNPDVVARLREEGLPDGHVVIFRQRLCYYDLNTSPWEASGGYIWNGTRAARWADVRALSPHVIRYGLGQPDQHYPIHLLAQPGGWHLSYFGGVDAVRTKMRAFLHQELVNDDTVNAAEARVAAGADAYGRDDLPWSRRPTSDVPPPVLANPDRWAHLWHEEYGRG